MPHSDHSPSPSPTEPFTDLPPFPDNVPTAPLLRISLAKLLHQDATEQDRCWRACRELGFFYLSLDGPDGSALLSSSSSLFSLMTSFFSLPVTEKVKYDLKSKGSYFGYKGYGEGMVDKNGTRDRNEFYNVSKDDILCLSEPLPSPACLSGEQQRALFKDFITQSHAVCETVITLMQHRLSLSSSARQDGGLMGRHRLSAVSGDQVRFVKAPPQEEEVKGISLGEHTDFGSVTVLFNRVGGLQVRLPEGMDAVPPVSMASEGGSAPGATTTGMSAKEKSLCQDGWCYVRPLPGHCVINLGDALVKFSAGVLRSNIHRVVAPPGAQDKVTRYSLVYFSRPEDDVVLKNLMEGAGENGQGVDGGDQGEEKVTAKEWILRRALGRRDPEGWEKSAGTEEGSMRRGGMRV